MPREDHSDRRKRIKKQFYPSGVPRGPSEPHPPGDPIPGAALSGILNKFKPTSTGAKGKHVYALEAEFEYFAGKPQTFEHLQTVFAEAFPDMNIVTVVQGDKDVHKHTGGNRLDYDHEEKRLKLTIDVEKFFVIVQKAASKFSLKGKIGEDKLKALQEKYPPSPQTPSR